MTHSILYREYFKLHPGPVIAEEVDKFREQHPEFPSTRTVKGTRTMLLRAGVLEPVEGESTKCPKKGPEGSWLGSYLRTKKSVRESIHRQRQIHL